MPVTIHDVAAHAGVSPATVSRAFSRPHKVADNTRESIERAARAVGYVPIRRPQNASARRFTKIGVLVPDLNNPFFAGVIRGIIEGAGANRHILIADFQESVVQELELQSTLRQSTDGLIVCSPRQDDESLVRLSGEFPIALVNRVVKGIPSVHFDNAGAISKALMHLRAMGHKHIGYCGGPEDSHSARERRDEFLKNSEETAACIYLGAFSPTTDGGREATDAVLNSGVTGVIMYNDLMAVGLMKLMTIYELPVPERLSVVGIDDIPVSEVVSPGLTTINLERESAGKAAIKLLDEASVKVTRLPAHLVVRSSTAKPDGIGSSARHI